MIFFIWLAIIAIALSTARPLAREIERRWPI